MKTYIENERGARGCCLFVKIRDPSFPGHAPGKDTLRAANAATERGSTGENRISGANSVVFPSYGKDPSFPGHAPGKDTLRAANAATKVGANGGENTRTSHAKLGCCRPRHIIYRSPENLTSFRSFAAIFAITALLPTVTSIFLARVTAVYSRFRVMSGAGQRRAGITTNGYSLP